MALTGVFPGSAEEDPPRTPVVLLLCTGCGLAQLGFSAEPEAMYGAGYGYRSALNRSMAHHLQRIARSLERRTPLAAGDVVCDIGSNDATLLRSYRETGIRRLGIDPLVAALPEVYQGDLVGVADFFSARTYWNSADRPAQIITSVAMLYDLENPREFFHDIAAVLAPGGVWFSEQSYAPWMVRSGAFDTICQEHLEYYTLGVLKGLLEEAGMHLVQAHTNEVNGGSLCFTAVRASGRRAPADPVAEWLLERERTAQLTTPAPWFSFAERVNERVQALRSLLTGLRRSGQRIMGLGASTKGNVLLQVIGEEARYLDAIGEVNPDKIGRVTPGTGIPIVSQQDVLAAAPDYLLILPWHFRSTFVEDLSDYLESGGRLILPLPEVEVISS